MVPAMVQPHTTSKICEVKCPPNLHNYQLHTGSLLITCIPSSQISKSSPHLVFAGRPWPHFVLSPGMQLKIYPFNFPFSRSSLIIVSRRAEDQAGSSFTFSTGGEVTAKSLLASKVVLIHHLFLLSSLGWHHSYCCLTLCQSACEEELLQGTRHLRTDSVLSNFVLCRIYHERRRS